MLLQRGSLWGSAQPFKGRPHIGSPLLVGGAEEDPGKKTDLKGSQVIYIHLTSKIKFNISRDPSPSILAQNVFSTFGPLPFFIGGGEEGGQQEACLLEKALRCPHPPRVF